MIMQLMSPESWLLVVNQEHERLAKNLTRIEMAPDAGSAILRVRQYWQRLGRRLAAPAGECCAVAPPLAR